MLIRPIDARDLEAWIAMRRVLHDGEDPDELGEEAARFFGGDCVLGLEAVLVCDLGDGRIGGYVEIGLRNYAEGCRSSPVPYVEAWYVTPEKRGTGIGRALIAAAEAWAVDRGHSELASNAVLENNASERAHKALGFEEVERSIHFRKPLAPR